jgi:hypothetical protein
MQTSQFALRKPRYAIVILFDHFFSGGWRMGKAMLLLDVSPEFIAMLERARLIWTSFVA